MIRYFWKYRFFNLALIFLGAFLCSINFKSVKVFFDSERIIELADVDQDVIEKSIDDGNLLLIGVELKDSLSFYELLKINSIF